MDKPGERVRSDFVFNFISSDCVVPDFTHFIRFYFLFSILLNLNEPIIEYVE